MKAKNKSARTVGEKRANRYGYLCVLPWILGFFLFTLIPMLFSAVLSLCDWDIVTGLSTVEFIGTKNYVRLFKDPDFYQALKVTFKFCLISIPFYQIMSLAIALLLNMRIRFMKAFRLIYFLPSIIPTIAASMIWIQIFWRVRYFESSVVRFWNQRAGMAE